MFIVALLHLITAIPRALFWRLSHKRSVKKIKANQKVTIRSRIAEANLIAYA